MSLSIALSLLAAAAASTGIDCDKSPYWSKGQDCTAVKLAGAEKELAAVWNQALTYAAVIDKNNSDDYDSKEPGQTAKAYLVASERAWIAYRNTTCHLDYFKDPGTLSRVVEGECMLAMTRLRIKGLKSFMEL
ncbi:MAG: lysozyme inhibitor LprI family protein [Novosphingobium sp.]